MFQCMSVNYPYHVFDTGKIVLFYVTQTLHFFALNLLPLVIFKGEGPSGPDIVMEILKCVVLKLIVKWG